MFYLNKFYVKKTVLYYVAPFLTFYEPPRNRGIHERILSGALETASGFHIVPSGDPTSLPGGNTSISDSGDICLCESNSSGINFRSRKYA